MTTRLTLVRQIASQLSPDGFFWLVYETDLDTYMRVGNWDIRDDERLGSLAGCRRWVRSRHWSNVVTVVEPYLEDFR